MTPPSLDFLIKRCLAKDPDERWQSAGDLLSQLEWIAEGGSQIGPSVATRQRRRTRESVAWILFGISTLFVSLLAGPAYRYWQGLQEADDVRFVVPTTAIPQAPHNALAISPDGRSIAFVAATTGDAMVLFVRPIGSLEAQQLPGTEGAGNPFWSPDSRQIAFTADGRLKKIDLAGGAPVTLCDMPGNNRAGTWNRDGVIVFAANAVLNRVSAAGGPSVPISTLDESRFEDHHTSPWFLPDGRHFLFSAWSADESNSALYVGALDSKETKLLLALSSKALYADPGYLLYQRQGTLFAHPFDAEDLAFTGDPIRLADDVVSGVPGVHSAFSVSGNGVLIYRTGVGRDEDFQLTWFDRSGRAVADLAPPGAYRGVDLSPDGTRVALHRHDGNGGDVWVLDASRPGALSRLTFDATQDNSMPIWSPDGNRIVFASTRNRRRGLYVKASDGSSNEELLVEGNSVNAMSWSPDSNFVLYSALSTATGADLWSVQLSGDRKPSPVVQGRADQLMGQISPDGKWLAYRSNETGRQEIYVQPFPAGAGRWQISASGGSFPRWRRDGRALYFVTVAGLMEAAIRPTESSFQSDVPRQLFVFTFIAPGHTGGVFHPYAVTADGQRFLVHRSISATATNNAPPPITVVVNWTAGLEK
jgi:Tol biopolymer transport system component